MTLAELNPDVALKALLDGKVKIGGKALTVYAQGEQPNVGVADDYITILYNGVISSLTSPVGFLRGNIALSIHCKLNSNRTIKLNRMRKIVAQCVERVDGKTSQGFVFSLDPANVITPPTPNDSTGYATTTINVKWRESR